jgi:hypothetical protein
VGSESSETQRAELRQELQRLIKLLECALNNYRWARHSQAMNAEDELTLIRIEQVVSQAEALGDILIQAEEQHYPWLITMRRLSELLKSNLLKMET